MHHNFHPAAVNHTCLLNKDDAEAGRRQAAGRAADTTADRETRDATAQSSAALWPTARGKTRKNNSVACSEPRQPENSLWRVQTPRTSPMVSMNPAPEDGIPEITSKKTMSADEFFPSSAMLRQRRQAPPFPSFCNSAHLKWLRWNGSLPNGSVATFNSYADRYDYVCKFTCEAGFYNPKHGPYCHYPYGDKEVKGEPFDILVNKDNFEILEWKDGSYGSVPVHSLRTCFDRDVYVGKNKYGLGKVHVKHKAFFLPWKGSEYFYKSYQVLTCNQDVYSEHISNVHYNINSAKIIQYPPESIRSFASTNSGSSPVLTTSTVSATVRVEKRWDIVSSVMAGIKTTFSGGIPGIISGSVDVTGEVSFQFSGGHTTTEENQHSVSIELTVPPKHTCKGHLAGYKTQANIPFTAHLSRTYTNGQTTWTSISGMYNIIQIGHIHAYVDNCEPVPALNNN
ncbi:natterin-3-like [Morone saxatilis]|uniref:natterin-3-like n=1 Tax=Morone saxatilis TaxID=34816 RepID=UPI0015E20412|nr:natterin-3-like [Morone saxatilis]